MNLNKGMMEVISLLTVFATYARAEGVLNRPPLLGAGTGLNSCAAPPFRAKKVHWVYGCPAFASCCSEFGFCRSQVASQFDNS